MFDPFQAGSCQRSLDGGAGNDIYYVSEAADVVVENGGGRDKVMSDIDFVLSDSLEDLWLNKGSSAISATGMTISASTKAIQTSTSAARPLQSVEQLLT